MKNISIKISIFLILIFGSQSVQSQLNFFVTSDSFCVNLGETFNLNVGTNDIIPLGLKTFKLRGDTSCFNLSVDGKLKFVGGPECCGDHRLSYEVTIGDDKLFASLFVQLKCPKPDCSIVELKPQISSNGTTPGGNTDSAKIYYTCQNSPTTYFTNFIPTNTYSWILGAGGTLIPGSNPAEVVVTWSIVGSNIITLLTNGVPTNYTIEVLPAPVAAFTTANACVCKSSPISFNNTSTGASSYYWTFGDGNNSSVANPTHTFAGPGLYTVTLYAYSTNFDPRGNPLCCCVDTSQMIIEVDKLSGPNIYWISTLCQGDTSKYWTDAIGCGYTWSVTNASNTPISFTGQGNDTICVVWGPGPHGNITLDLNSCSPAVWCEKPVTVQVPIISSVSNVTGSTKVCAGSKEKYTLPKWNGTIYNWTVNGGMILEGQGTHEVLIMWGAGPTATINVNYNNPFLQGLPIHDGNDCKGTANLTVNIKPEWDLVNIANIICKGSSTSIFANVPSPITYVISSSTYNNVVTASVGLSIPLTNAGNYKICAYPVNPNIYCNDTICTSVFVDSIGPVDSISGPMMACPNVLEYYTAHSSTSGVQYMWTVTGGTPSSFTGNPIAVTWTPGVGRSLSVKQVKTNNPYCMSSLITKAVTIKKINPIGSIVVGDSCTNTIQNFSVMTSQDPSATYTWTIVPAINGSVVSGQGSKNVSIQWNINSGSTTIHVGIKLCNDTTTFTKNIILVNPVVPNIIQTGYLCNGVKGVLSVGPSFISAVWNSGTPGPMNTDSITAPGLYVVTTTDMNGCTAKDNFTANSIIGPSASISTGNLERICIPIGSPAPSVTYTALTNVNYSYTWYCNGVAQPPQSPPHQFRHIATNIVSNFSYYVKITDVTTGCMENSLPRVVVQDSCRLDTCSPAGHSVTIIPTQSIPNCNIYSFAYSNTGATIIPVGWNFGTIYGTAGGTVASPTFQYSFAGNYPIVFDYLVPNRWGTGYCTGRVTSSVSVPVAPRFTHLFTGACREVKFTNTSTLLPGVSILSVMWDFGDGTPTSPLIMPTHTFPNPGTYNVTLTITTNTGCVTTYTVPITVQGISTPTYSVMSSPACVGDNVMFNFSGFPSDILTFLYNFGDGSYNAASSPKHAYLTANTYNTSLMVTDIYNCSSTANVNVVIHPKPAKDTIKYLPKLKVCEGTNVTLMAPSGAGYTYQWSNGATSQTITTSISGNYSVVVTNSFMCSTKLDSVKVVICPAPAAPVFGPNYICDNNCFDLNTVSGMTSYQWYDKNGLAIPGQTIDKLNICPPFTIDSFYVVVTDANGCTKRSSWHKITKVIPPTVSINVVTGTPICAGSSNQFTALSASPNVSFQWNTGASTPTIIATQVGTYTVVVTDTITGCTGKATVIVNPIPDFCEMPAGCYEVCIPDTICGPIGMAGYMWTYNGVMMTPGNTPCIEVTKAGSYSLKATNSFGCSASSDTLILQTKICCDTADTKITALPVTPGVDNCCYNLSYVNTLDSLMTLCIYSNNANITFTSGSVHSSLNIIGTSPNTITLASSVSGQPLPKVALNNFIKLCASNITSSPVVVYFNWGGPDGDKLCQDSIILNCNPSECVYIKKDSIQCNLTTGGYTYGIRVCNPITNNFTFGYINIIELLPVGVIVSPSAMNVNILPGVCTTLVFNITGSNLQNQNFCYNLVAHEADPAQKPDARCCAIDTIKCIQLPGCNPCDSSFVKSVKPTDEKNCCFKVTLSNYYSNTAYNGIKLCGIDAGATITVNNAFGSGWNTGAITPNTFVLNYATGNIPKGDFTLPEFCVDNPGVTFNNIEVKWLGGIPQNVKCRDTFKVKCNIECGFWEYKKVICEGNKWLIQGIFHNTSNQTVYNASISFNPAVSGANTTYNFIGGVVPGGSYGPINILIDQNLFPQGTDTLCMLTNLHNNLGDLKQVCCQFKTILVVPPCNNNQSECLCDSKFTKEADKGVSCIFNGKKVTFTPLGIFTDCDRVIYEFNYPGGIAQVFSPVQPTIHTFPAVGNYEVCITFERTDINGKKCRVKICKLIKIKNVINFSVSPNPAKDFINVNIKAENEVFFENKISLLNMNGIELKSWNKLTDEDGNVQLPLEGLPVGIYFIRLEGVEEVLFKKFIIIE
jgi:PKD repeat protein